MANRKNLGDELVESMRQARDHAKGASNRTHETRVDLTPQQGTSMSPTTPLLRPTKFIRSTRSRDQQ